MNWASVAVGQNWLPSLVRSRPVVCVFWVVWGGVSPREDSFWYGVPQLLASFSGTNKQTTALFSTVFLSHTLTHSNSKHDAGGFSIVAAVMGCRGIRGKRKEVEGRSWTTML